jgi:hypothetical protein
MNPIWTVRWLSAVTGIVVTYLLVVLVVASLGSNRHPYVFPRDAEGASRHWSVIILLNSIKSISKARAGADKYPAMYMNQGGLCYGAGPWAKNPENGSSKSRQTVDTSIRRDVSDGA